jgi:hypothetical protein
MATVRPEHAFPSGVAQCKPRAGRLAGPSTPRVRGAAALAGPSDTRRASRRRSMSAREASATGRGQVATGRGRLET